MNEKKLFVLRIWVEIIGWLCIKIVKCRNLNISIYIEWDFYVKILRWGCILYDDVSGKCKYGIGI